MKEIQYRVVKASDDYSIRLIADWYFTEWKIPTDQTLQRLKLVSADSSQCQVLMMVDGLPVATGGLYSHVGLIDKVPRLGVYRNWLALIYTTPGDRQKGYGTLICNFIEAHAKEFGIDKMHLFTDTAERLYRRLGWTEMERLQIGARNIVIMEKELAPG